MLFIHTADLHLDSALTARLSDEKRIQRRREHSAVLRRVLEDGIARGAQATLISGDLFDTQDVRPYTVRATLQLIASIAPHPVFYVAGNHEGDVLLHREDLPSNLHIFGEVAHTVRLGDVTVSGCSGKDAVQALRALSLPMDTYNIVLLHAAVADASGEDHVRLLDLADTSIDYLALGHYHGYATYSVSDRLSAVYAGAPEGRGFDELGEKGYVLLDTEHRSARFIPCAQRRIEEISVDLSGMATDRVLERAIDASLREHGVRSCDLVRVRLTGRYDTSLGRDLTTLSALFEPRFFSFELRDDSRPRLSPESFRHDPTLKGEFVRLVYAQDGLSDEEKEDIVACGLSYLQEGADEG